MSPEDRLFPNFKIKEVDCCCGCNAVLKNPSLVSVLLLSRLEILRAILKKPIHINRCFTCKKHNKKIKGAADKSFHLFGMAADIWVKGLSPRKLAIWCAFVGFTGIKVYKNHVHVDVRPWVIPWIR